jgi:hypothetical protein
MADPPELPGGWLPPQAPERQPSEPPRQQAPPVFVREGGAPQPRNPLAITATVFAVSSMGLLVFSLGLSFFFSLPLGIAGWVCASRSDPELNPGQRKTGQMLSIIAVALSVAAMVIWLLLFAAGVTLEDLQRLQEDLERQRRES